MIGKKYLIANGCSFTEGHLLGNDVAWPKFLGQKMNLEVINLGKGGSGNDTITWRTLDFCETNKDIAKESLFVIQLTECLRYHIYFDDFENQPSEFHVTPMCFVRDMQWNKDGSPVQQWVYKNRKELVYIYSNITLALYKTLQNIITLTSYFDSHSYPYVLFDGINDHKPVKFENGYYLLESHGNKINPFFRIKTSLDVESPDDYNIHVLRREKSYIIHEKLIDSIFSNNKIFKKIPVLLKYLREKGSNEHNDADYYFKGNAGHPNELACDVWSDVLKEYIEEIFGQSK